MKIVTGAERVEALRAIQKWPAKKVLPVRPLGAVAFPVCRFGKPGGQAFGQLQLRREVKGSRNRAGKMEILCRYGHAERWYEVRQ